MGAMYEAGRWSAAGVAAERRGRRVSVVIPARDEAATIGAVVGAIAGDLMGAAGVVDELVVVDDGSSDATAEIAAAAGATVVAAGSVVPGHGGDHGKGQAMWDGLAATTGDVVAFCDADVVGFGAHFVLGVVGPVLAHDAPFVKGHYARPLDGRDGEGGRVTELAARPLVALLFPHLAGIVQPLAGECAGRRDVLESVPFVGGYGVDLGLLIDITAAHGPGAISQSDLGRRVHRNRPLGQLSAQALAIWQVGLARAGLVDPDVRTPLLRPGADPVLVALAERPPLATVAERRRSA